MNETRSKPEISPMDSVEVIVSNRLGIHARTAAMFVRVANRFEADIMVEKDGERINGKSIMGLMMLAAGPGSRIRITASGEDFEKALIELQSLFEKKFNEE